MGNNIFAYCRSNPLMGYDPTGMRPATRETIADYLVTTIAAICGAVAGVKAAVRTKIKGKSNNAAMAAGIANGSATFGMINNTVNAYYYNNISTGESSLETKYSHLQGSERKSDYVDGYINRWERLDYTKKVTQSETYDANAWRFQSEYALHMYLWGAVDGLQGKGIWLADRIGTSAIHAHIEVYSPDPDWKIQSLTNFVGYLGL